MGRVIRVFHARGKTDDVWSSLSIYCKAKRRFCRVKELSADTKTGNKSRDWRHSRWQVYRERDFAVHQKRKVNIASLSPPGISRIWDDDMIKARSIVDRSIKLRDKLASRWCSTHLFVGSINCMSDSIFETFPQ